MLGIIVPFYKLSYFEKALESLANQTIKNFKVYIGNDASPEDCKFLIDKYSNVLDINYKKFETNLGSTSLVGQWNRCIEMLADEEWVMILGDDDLIEENVVEAFYNNLETIERQGVNVVRFASVKINAKHEHISHVVKNPRIETSVEFLMRRLRGETRSSLSEFVFRMKVLKTVGFKDLPLAWHSDVLGVLEFSNFREIYSINEALAYIRSSGINISSRSDNINLKNIATFKFYHYLLSSKSGNFDLQQLEILYERLEKCFLDNKRQISFWRQLTSLYLKRFRIKKYLFFLVKYVKSGLKSIFK